MSNIQYQLNKRYRLEIKQKTQEYYAATEHIRKERVKLRNVFLPKIILKDGKCEFIYPDEFLKIDIELKSLQNLVWNAIFAKNESPTFKAPVP